MSNQSEPEIPPDEIWCFYSGGLQLWINGQPLLDPTGMTKYTRADLAQHDIARLQELNTQLLNGGELNDTLDQLRKANALIEICRSALNNTRQYQVCDEIDKIVMPALNTIQTYRKKEQAMTTKLTPAGEVLEDWPVSIHPRLGMGPLQDDIGRWYSKHAGEIRLALEMLDRVQRGDTKELRRDSATTEMLRAMYDCGADAPWLSLYQAMWDAAPSLPEKEEEL